MMVPYFTGMVVFILLVSVLYKGLSALSFDPDLAEALALAGMVSAMITLLCFIQFNYISRNRRERASCGPTPSSRSSVS